MTLRKIIGENIRGYRHAAGYTQAALAVRAKIDMFYLGKLERGEVNVSADTMEKIAKSLKVPIHTFFIEQGYRSKI